MSAPKQNRRPGDRRPNRGGHEPREPKEIRENRETKDAKQNAEAPDGEDERCCVVCFRSVDIYSVGECDHPVCFECSTRMRVLCMQNECPICRHQLHKVIFTPDCLPFKEINTQTFSNNLFERRYKIGFANEEVKRAYLKLLEHNCKECGGNVGPFRNFEALKAHMKSHDLYYCDLCVGNLKIFTVERKCYTKQLLQLHMKKGDPDDSSHKGHPLCEFCVDRFMDSDELYRHLRKHHLYCHLCDVDGFDFYYSSYAALGQHFRKEHYLCEEGECGEASLTAVFRTDIDLIAHKALEHGKGLSKQASRQARTLELQFTYTPRGQIRTPRLGLPVLQTRPESFRAEEEEEAARELPREEPPRPGPTPPSIDTRSAEQFPSLGASASSSITVTRPIAPMVIRQTAGALVKTDQNFPALGGEPSGSSASTVRVNITHQAPSMVGPSNAIIKNTVKPNLSIQVHNRPTTASNFKLEPTKQHTVKPDPQLYEDMKRFEDDFPSLNKKDKNLLLNSYTSLNSNVPMNSIVKKMSAPAAVVQPAVAAKPLNLAPKAPPPPSSSTAFPALCPTTSLTPKQPQWIVSAKPKEQPPKPSKVAPAPQIPTMTNINSASDFPLLSVKNKNKKGGKAEMNNNRPAAEEPKQENGKKEKKKNKNDEINVQSTSDSIRKSIPPDTNNILNQISGNKKKSEPEPTWVDWKGKKNNNNKQNEKPVNPQPKKADPPMKVDDFPALSANKNVAGFKNTKNNSNENTNPNVNNKLSYSANLKKANETNTINGKSNQSNKTSPPPSVFQNSIPPCNGFTFTNSSGQNYNIPVYNYLEPTDFNQRNKALVINFMTALSSQESIDEFKQFSRQFREGVYSAESYYEHCKSAIGREFQTLFPELLALLPDISKQQELFEIYSKKSPTCELEICSTCGQILLPDDRRSHINSHSLIENFPTLGDSAPTWRK